MKINWNKRYTTYAIYAAIISAAIIFCIFVGVYFDSVWSAFNSFLSVISPLIYGFCIAYILSPLHNILEKKVFFWIKRSRLRRGVSVCLTYLLFVTAIALILYAVIVPLTDSIPGLQMKLKSYSVSLNGWIANAAQGEGMLASIANSIMNSELYKIITSPVEQILDVVFDFVQNSGAEILGFVSSFVDQFVRIVIGVIFSGYLLCSKEYVFAQVNKLLHVLFKQTTIKKIKDVTAYADKTFGKYLIGTLFDAAIVGILVALSMFIFGMPYIPLISVLCACTNIIPIFGPFIGAVPSVIFIFIDGNPIQALWFIVIILIIQQIDGNFIAPRILGSSTGLPALFVIIAIVVMGGFFGILGMIIGVPTFAVIGKYINDKTDEKAKKKADLEAYELKLAIERAEAEQDGDRYENSLRELDRLQTEKSSSFVNHRDIKDDDDVLEHTSAPNGTEGDEK